MKLGIRARPQERAVGQKQAAKPRFCCEATGRMVENGTFSTDNCYKKIREALGVQSGDRVTLISQDNQVIMMNSAVYAMKVLQEAMQGEAEKAGILSVDDAVNIARALRSYAYT